MVSCGSGIRRHVHIPDMAYAVICRQYVRSVLHTPETSSSSLTVVLSKFNTFSYQKLNKHGAHVPGVAWMSASAS